MRHGKEYLYIVRYPDPENRTLNRVILNISVELREATLTIRDSIKRVLLVESKIVRVGFLSTTDLTSITQFNKKRSSRSEYLNALTNEDIQDLSELKSFEHESLTVIRRVKK